MEKKKFSAAHLPPPTGHSHETQSWTLVRDPKAVSLHLLVSQPTYCNSRGPRRARPRTPFRSLLLPISHCWAWNPSKGPLELVPFPHPSATLLTSWLELHWKTSGASSLPSYSIHLSVIPITMLVWDCGIQITIPGRNHQRPVTRLTISLPHPLPAEL